MRKILHHRGTKNETFIVSTIDSSLTHLLFMFLAMVATFTYQKMPWQYSILKIVIFLTTECHVISGVTTDWVLTPWHCFVTTVHELFSQAGQQVFQSIPSMNSRNSFFQSTLINSPGITWHSVVTPDDLFASKYSQVNSNWHKSFSILKVVSGTWYRNWFQKMHLKFMKPWYTHCIATLPIFSQFIFLEDANILLMALLMHFGTLKCQSFWCCWVGFANIPAK